MPCFRGIGISIAVIQEDGSPVDLPEFPHPDGSSVRRSSSSPTRNNFSIPSPKRPGTPKEGQSTDHDGPKPTISVYVPSAPDSKFFFNYAIKDFQTTYKYLFFKVVMNGRVVVSWGIDLGTVEEGAAFRALYEPSHRFRSLDDGEEFDMPGIEARYFKFMPSLKTNSVADDGGLIEVQVFRAKARAPRAPRLEQCRNQVKYGVGVLSDGLLDNPEDMTFYDYHLCDPRDSPYAAFRFHYRTLENLQLLQLVPADTSRISKSLSLKSKVSSHTDGATRDSQLDLFGKDACDELVFEDAPGRATPRDNTGCSRSAADHSSALNPPTKLDPVLSTSSDMVDEPSKARRDHFHDSYLQRPLPPIPESRAFSSPGRRSSASSVTSRASVTPSLRSYLDTSSFLDDSFEIGIARQVEIVLHHDPSRSGGSTSSEGPARDSVRTDKSAASMSEYEDCSVPPSEKSTAGLLPSPGNYLATADAQPDPDTEYSPLKWYEHKLEVHRRSHGSQTPPDFGSMLSPSEAEWLKAPLASQPSTCRGWSPTLGTRETGRKDALYVDEHGHRGTASSPAVDDKGAGNDEESWRWI